MKRGGRMAGFHCICVSAVSAVSFSISGGVEILKEFADEQGLFPQLLLKYRVVPKQFARSIHQRK